MELTLDVEKRLGAFLLRMDFGVTGDRIGIFGPSGSGKSSLVGLIAGLSSPDRGRIILDGDILFDAGKKKNMPVRERRIGMVFQRPHLFPHFTVKGNLLYGYNRCTPKNRNIRLESVVDVLQIGHLLDRGIRHLSGGEQQRVGIGRAILSNPRLLLLDEPLTGLDNQLKFQIIPFLKSASEAFRIPYLFISHSVLEMRIMTDRLLSVNAGSITQESSTEHLAREVMGDSSTGYLNLIEVSAPLLQNGLVTCPWGDQMLWISQGNHPAEGLYGLSSRDIILFKRHPEAVSAQNLIQCRVSDIFKTGQRFGVELDCGGAFLVAEVVQSAITNLSIAKGSELYIAVKATAFRRLG